MQETGIKTIHKEKKCKKAKWLSEEALQIAVNSARFGSTYTKIGTIQRRLAWPLRKDDTQIREAFPIFEQMMLG